MDRGGRFGHLARQVPGMGAIVLLAAGLGFAFNTVNPNGLPLIRKPLRETRAFATTADIVGQKPASTQPATTLPSAKSASQPIASATPLGVSLAPPTAQPLPSQIVAPVTSPPEPESSKKVEALFTTLKDAKAVFDKKGAIFVDGRAPEDYQAEHVAGALSLFCEDVEKLYQKVLVGVPKDHLIVTYCSDAECTEAINLADGLVALGYTRVVILLEGLPGWKEAGYPTVKGKERG